MRRSLLILAVFALIAVATFLYGLAEARRDPVVRQATVALADWPAGAAPVRVALLSDLHVGSVTMGPERLARIVGQVQALNPDLVLLAGDFIDGHERQDAVDAAPDLAAGLSRLHAPLGIVAVLGNHDHSTDPVIVRRALTAARVTLLVNAATQRGPLVIGGIDDVVTQHHDVPKTLAAMDRLVGAKILLDHAPGITTFIRSPYLVRKTPLPPQTVLAGHTHCGQIVLPLIGPVMAIFDRRRVFPCGMDRAGIDRTVVTGGLGTSILPIRIGAPPDLWLLTLGPAAARVSRPRF